MRGPGEVAAGWCCQCYLRVVRVAETAISAIQARMTTENATNLGSNTAPCWVAGELAADTAGCGVQAGCCFCRPEFPGFIGLNGLSGFIGLKGPAGLRRSACADPEMRQRAKMIAFSMAFLSSSGGDYCYSMAVSYKCQHFRESQAC